MTTEPLMTTERLDELMRLVFQELIKNDGRAHGRQVLAAVASKVSLTDAERSLNTGGTPRWETNIRFHTTDCSKAGFLQKSAGYWTITEDGRKALGLPKGELIREARRRYRAWLARQEDGDDGVTGVKDPDKVDIRGAAFELAEEQARTGIEQHIHQLSPYEFQDLVGHLMRGMGYFVAHNAPPGPDGGVDLLVYKDPLGTIAPRIKVQVKHRPDYKLNVKEIRELHGLLQHDEVGLLVSTGGFTSDAAKEARAASKHVDMIDLERFVTLWQQHYDKLSEEGRAMLPLAPIFFLAPTEE